MRPSAGGPAGARAVAVAASGGRDSTALLHAVARWGAAHGVMVHALHVHHGLHGDADLWQARLQRQVRRWARGGLPVTCHVERLSTAPIPGDSIEAWARRERYAALARMAQAGGCDLVLLAQHRRDQAETVLLQALRGGGARGLAAMPRLGARHGIVWGRPWLDQPREAIEHYLRRHRLSWSDDASNLDGRYRRNRVRHDVWPVLVQAFSDAEPALASVSRRAAQEAICLQELARQDLALHGCSGSGRFEPARLHVLPEARRANALRWRLGAMLGRAPSQSLLDRLMTECQADRPGRWPVPGGWLCHYRGWLEFETARAPACPLGERLLDLSTCGCHDLGAGLGALQVSATRAAGVPAELLRQVRLRQRRPGDRLAFEPGAMERSLKKQFQARGVASWQRSGLVLEAGGQVLFVPGLGLNARCLATKGAARRRLLWLHDAPPGGPHER